jgi:5'-nucleotidase
MRVLITNDDGIDSPGIHALARAAADAGADVVVAAPAKEASGTSASISAVEENGRVVVDKRELPGLDGVAAYAVAGSPGFITLIAAREAFGPKPDIVLSGVNRGLNAGHAVLHSGTVGAALTAGEVGCRAIAVSLDVLAAPDARASTGGAAVVAVVSDETARHWASAATLAVGLLDRLAALPEATVLNLNVPDRPADRIAGLRRARLAPFGQVQMSVAELGQGFIRLSLLTPAEEPPADSDLALLRQGYATLTPLRGVTADDGVEIDLSGDGG